MLINEKKNKKNYSPLYFCREKKSEKAKTLGICPSFSGKVGDGQIQKNPVSPPPNFSRFLLFTTQQS